MNRLLQPIAQKSRGSIRWLSRSSAIKDYSAYLSPISSRRQPSAIRKLMPLMNQPGMVSLGGGLPNSSLFPFASLQVGIKDPAGSNVHTLELTQQELGTALQYSPTPGLPSLLEQLNDLQRREHGVSMEQYSTAVTVGSQDGLTKAFEMLLDPTEDELFVENPCYSGALAFLHPFGVKLNPVAMDGDGMIPESLEEALDKSSKSSDHKRKVLYTIPTAQNPAGTTLSNTRRHEIYDLACQHNMIIMEDDPYYFLHPDRNAMNSFLSMDTQGRVLRFDSTSKLISSGIRIGFVTGPTPLMERLNFHTQATNLHNSGISQVLVLKLLEHWGEAGFDQHARAVADFYSQRRDVIIAAADLHLSGLAEWNVPQAGMFLWMKLNGIADTKALIEEKAAAANVLFVPGQSFDPLNRPSSYVRASYSTASDEDIDIAMERLATLIRTETTGNDSSKTAA